MRLFSIFILSFTFYTSTQAQQLHKNNILFDVGGGMGLYSSYNNINYDKPPVYTNFFKLQGGVLLNERFAIGLQLRQNIYAFDNNPEKNVQFDKIEAGMLLFNSTYYLVNKENINFHIETSIGGSHLDIKGLTQNDVLVNLQGDGFTYALSLGIKRYLAKFIGLYFKAGFINYAYNVDRLSLEFEEYYQVTEDNLDFKINHSGIDLQAGITFRFN